MSDNMMPERVWCYLGRDIYPFWEDEDRLGATEYIRADVAAEQVAAAEDTATQAIRAAIDLQKQLDAANASIDELEAAQRWIPVGERLPPPLDEVIVTDGVTVAIGYASKNGTWNLYGWSDLTVTHWMPLPMPPQP